MINSITEFYWQPLLPGWAMILLALLSFGLLTALAWRTRHLPVFRGLFVLLVLILIANPVLKTESGTPSETLVYVLVDRTESQRLSGRVERTEETLADVMEKLNRIENLAPVVVDVTQEGLEDRTRLFGPLQDMLLAETPSRIGGSILITDGQVHDVPADPGLWTRYGPLHVLMSGDPEEETDRRIEILSSPGYAVVGESAPLRIRVDEDPVPQSETLTMTVKINGEVYTDIAVPTGEDYSLRLPITQSGKTLVEVSIPATEDELSPINNTAATSIEGVRDRLKVLLVSGQPHQGLRIWRNLLKSDPAVDLVHFTILRSLNNIDITPQDELALIPFPTQELFEDKIAEFDLIILDRYTRRSILQASYFRNMVRYVEDGGAMMVVHGPEESGQEALADTYLDTILPTRRVLNGVVEKNIHPKLSDYGRRHPITAPLEAIEDSWGDWNRYLEVTPTSENAQTLLETKDGAPLLVISDQFEGRVAQFSTDQIWLWARGYDGGGPYADIMRRLAHWLMKEPSLEYKNFRVEGAEGDFYIRYEGENIDEGNVTITTPDQSRKVLKPKINQLAEGRIEFEIRHTPALPGVYHFRYGPYEEHLIYKDTNAPEYQKLISNTELLYPAAESTDGALVRSPDAPDVHFSMTEQRARYSRGDNLYLRQSSQLENRDVEIDPLLPWWLVGVFGIFFMVAGWLRQE